MLNSLVAKLEHFTHLSGPEQDRLPTLASETVQHYEPGATVVREGDTQKTVRLVTSGWACRSKQLPGRRRQIMAILLPGDLCDHAFDVLSEADHSIDALTAVTLSEIPAAALEAMMTDHPHVARALRWDLHVHAAVQREWSLNLGRRTAVERLGHLFCELFYRSRAIGQVEDVGCEMPLTLTDLADVLGLTPVHVNRALQTLRQQELVELEQCRLRVPDLLALERAALFTPSYLHLEPVGARLDA